MIHHNTARKRIGFYLINTSRPRKQLGINACISSRITTVIQVVKYYQINYNWYNEPFAVSQYKCLYLDMHGLIFETSVWLLAGSTRLLVPTKMWTSGAKNAHGNIAPQRRLIGCPHSMRRFVYLQCLSKFVLTRSRSTQAVQTKGSWMHAHTNRCSVQTPQRGLPHSSGLLESFPSCSK